MLIKIKNQFFNSDKVLKLNYAVSEKNQKNYLIVELDTTKPQSKEFIEVTDSLEFDAIIQSVSNQLSR